MSEKKLVYAYEGVEKKLRADNAALQKQVEGLQKIATDALNILVSWQIDWEIMANDRDYLPDLSKDTIRLQEELKIAGGE